MYSYVEHNGTRNTIVVSVMMILWKNSGNMKLNNKFMCP